MTTDDLIENRHDDGFLNIADHDSYIHGVPHASFARLRAEDISEALGRAIKGPWSSAKSQAVRRRRSRKPEARYPRSAT